MLWRLFFLHVVIVDLLFSISTVLGTCFYHLEKSYVFVLDIF